MRLWLLVLVGPRFLFAGFMGLQPGGYQGHYLAAAILALFGVIDSLSTAYGLLVAPLGVQEMVLAAWLIVKGFNPSTVASESVKADTYKVQARAERESVR